jgi:hypothetical protein
VAQPYLNALEELFARELPGISGSMCKLFAAQRCTLIRQFAPD